MQNYPSAAIMRGRNRNLKLRAMRIFYKLIFTTITLFAFVANSYSIEEGKAKTIETNDTIQANQNKQVTVQDASEIYTCPMDPEVISNKPGNCPKCGMELVVKNSDSNSHKHKMMGCMNMMHTDNHKSHIWMYFAGGAIMVVMMVLLVLR